MKWNATLSASLGLALVSALVLPASASAATQTFSNPAPITIEPVGAASPYPSTIDVSGLGTTVTDVNVTLTGYGHLFPNDVDVLLAGPAGQTVVLMSDAPNDGLLACAEDVSGIDLTFDDEAPGPLPLGGPLVTGAYQPTDYDPGQGSCQLVDSDDFPDPAPAEPYGSALSVFDGTDPNGTWRLYVVDDTMQDGGEISGGWSLEISVAEAAITFTSGPPPAGTVGEPYQHQFTATGDSDISYAVTSGTLPPGLSLAQSGALSGTPTEAGSYVFTVTATSGSGGSASQPVAMQVSQPPPPPPPSVSADLSVHLTGSPNPVKSGRTLTYTVTVSNAEPDTAPSVRMTDVLPSATQFASISPGPGWSCSTPPVGSTGTVTCTASALGSGVSSTITLTVTVVSSGKTTISDTAEVSSAADDPNPANDSATVTTSVQGRR